MARISVEQKALTDPRFELLGNFLGSNRHEALGRMILIWNECQERGTYTLPERLVGAVMGSHEGASWVIESDLAVRVDKNEVRIKGTQGRIEWLDAKRKASRINGKKGGRPPANRSETNDGSTSHGLGLQPETPPAPAPAPAPAQVSSNEETSSHPPKIETPPQPPPAGVSETELITAWNGLGKPFPRILSFTDSRKRALNSRNRDRWWVENWLTALNKIPKSPFLRGESDRGWVADIDWFLRPDTVQKLIEGKYSHAGSGQGVRSGARIFDEEGRYGAKEPIIAGGDVGDHAGAVQGGDAHHPPQAS